VIDVEQAEAGAGAIAVVDAAERVVGRRRDAARGAPFIEVYQAAVGIGLRRADDEVRDAVPGHVAGGEDTAESETCDFEIRRYRRRRGQIARAAERRPALDHVNATGAGSPDDDFAIAIVVEVSGRQRASELIAGPADDRIDRIGRREMTVGGEPAGKDVDDAFAAERSRRANDEVARLRSFRCDDIAGRGREAELIARGRAADRCIGIGEVEIAAARRAAEDDVDGPGNRRRSWRADDQIAAGVPCAHRAKIQPLTGFRAELRAVPDLLGVAAHAFGLRLSVGAAKPQ
jgi:hypothetical protein